MTLPTPTPTIRIARVHDHRGLGPRTTARVLSLADEADRTIARAVESGEPRIRARTGGSVANAYSYPAHTDAVLAVGFPDGRGALWATRIPANKCTLSGAIAAAYPGRENVRPLCDDRYRRGGEQKRAARAAVLATAEAAWSAGEPSDITINGVWMPATWVRLGCPVSPTVILEEPNVEVRRILMEIYGLDQFFAEAGAMVMHTDAYGTLLHLDTPEETIAAVRVRNSTAEPDGSHREYVLRVPPDISTAHAAVAWTFGMRPADYHPSIET